MNKSKTIPIRKTNKAATHTLLLFSILCFLTSGSLKAQGLGHFSNRQDNPVKTANMPVNKISTANKNPAHHVLCDSVRADSILVTNSGLCTFLFDAANPQNAEGYQWDFGDGTTWSNSPSVSHTFGASGTYHITLIISNGCSSDTLYTTVSCVDSGTSINSINTIHQQLSLYPNPALEVLNIHFYTTTAEGQRGTIKLLDIIGRTLQAQTIRIKSGENNYRLNVSKLAPGMYFLKIKNNRFTNAVKFVKQ